MVKKFVITTHMEVDAPIEKVKEVIWSLKKCELWNQSVERVDLLQEEDEGVGKARVCNFYNVPDGGFVHEVIGKQTDDTIGLYLTTNKPKIMSYVGPEFRVEKIDDKKTKLTSMLVYRPALMPLTYCLATTVIKKEMVKGAWAHGRGVKTHCETGEVCSPDTKLHGPDEAPEYDFQYIEYEY